MMKSKLELKEESGEVMNKKAWKKPTFEACSRGAEIESNKPRRGPAETTYTASSVVFTGGTPS